MKALPKKLLPLLLFGIAVTSLFSIQPAQAFTITLEQMGSNVVATGSGAINLTGLNFQANLNLQAPNITANSARIITRTANADIYTGFTGPTSFGSGGFFSASANSGDGFGFGGLANQIGVPHNYVSNTALTSSATWNNRTFATLGVTPGTYVWSWGTGLPNQNFTLQIGAAGVPDGGTTVSLLGCAFLGLAALRRKLGC
jgi:VPDSG-CTERM motif